MTSFNPRPLASGRRSFYADSKHIDQFQSTPARERATYYLLLIKIT
jgi:hypothetical protein